MIRSMTAFARVSAPAPLGKWIVEIRSVNHRYFEFSLKVPPSLYSLEGRVRERVQAQLRRGKVSLSIIQDNGQEAVKGLSLDETAVRSYLAAVEKLKKRFRLQGQISISDLIQVPGLFSFSKPEEDPEKNWLPLQRALKKVLAEAVKAKQREGGKLARDISSRVRKISQAVARIELLAAETPKRLFEKLKGRVEELLAEKEKDLDRVTREVAFLAERSDITEEIVRMKSHLELFEKRLKSETEVGRELDFLCQEMNREINTLGSKAQLFEISTEVVFVKGELEKIREQIQNIE